MNGKTIREYVDDYIKYYPEKWSWSLKNSIEQSERYMETRARKSKDFYGTNNDLLPDFYSIERDAAQFGLSYVEWTDFFGLIWEGKKGIHAMVGAPNYEGNLYYYEEENDYDEAGYRVSYEYDAYKNQPPEEVFSRVNWCGVNHWIDTVNVKDIVYKYVVENHLFKDTHIELFYDDGEMIRVYADYQPLVDGLYRHGRMDLLEKVFKSMNEHFIKLRDSDCEEEREFYPGKTAEEIFLGDK